MSPKANHPGDLPLGRTTIKLGASFLETIQVPPEPLVRPSQRTRDMGPWSTRIDELKNQLITHADADLPGAGNGEPQAPDLLSTDEGIGRARSKHSAHPSRRVGTDVDRLPITVQTTDPVLILPQGFCRRFQPTLRGGTHDLGRVSIPHDTLRPRDACLHLSQTLKILQLRRFIPATMCRVELEAVRTSHTEMPPGRSMPLPMLLELSPPVLKALRRRPGPGTCHPSMIPERPER